MVLMTTLTAAIWYPAPIRCRTIIIRISTEFHIFNRPYKRPNLKFPTAKIEIGFQYITGINGAEPLSVPRFGAGGKRLAAQNHFANEKGERGSQFIPLEAFIPAKQNGNGAK